MNRREGKTKYSMAPSGPEVQDPWGRHKGQRASYLSEAQTLKNADTLQSFAFCIKCNEKFLKNLNWKEDRGVHTGVLWKKED